MNFKNVKMESGIEKIQSKEFDVFKELLRVFKIKNYRYFITGGTVLGSIHYGGFIPYDDDIDICMPRKDYNLLIRDCQKYLSNDYKLRHYSLDSNFKYTIIRVENQSINISELTDPFQRTSHPSIDIAPLDGVPNNFFNRYVFFLKLGFLRNILSWYYASSINTYKDRKKISILIIKLLKLSQKFARIVINPSKVKFKIDKILSKVDFKDSSLAGTYMGAYRKKEMIPSYIWGDGKTYDFNGIKVRGPQNADLYVKAIYGKFRDLTPTEALKARHYIIKEK